MAKMGFVISSVATLFLLNFLFLSAHSFEGDHGDICNTTLPCRFDLDCVSGSCQCRFPGHQNYDRETGQCISLLQGPCEDKLENGTVIEYSCTTNAVCKDVNGFRECACKDGLIQKERSCKVPFGQPCSTTNDCYNPPSSSSTSVICKEGRCDCPNLEIFDEKTGRCQGLVGARCGLSSQYSVCIAGAECERYDSSNGICRCTGTNVPTPDRKCVPQQCRSF